MSEHRQLGRRVVLARHPEGAMQVDDFRVENYTVPVLSDGEFLVQARYISVDPMLRLFIDKAPLGGMIPPMTAGALIPGASVGEVTASRNPDFAVGDRVEGRFGWQSLAVSNGAGVNAVSPVLGDVVNALGAGGLPGFTAYCGIVTAGGVTPDQTWLVSGAAGAVGSILGPLVRARRGRAVGIAGGPDKCRYLVDQCGYAAAVDRHSPDFHQRLAEAMPEGADVYFDNVGGPMLADMTRYLARGALVLICGLMSTYQADGSAQVDDRLDEVLKAVMFKGLRIQGFSQVGLDRLRPAFVEEIGALVANGDIKPDVHIRHGIDSLPTAMIDLFGKGTTGKVVVCV
ncbi:MAG TPA: NADP-dependent oxidoreductase [Sphingobium sp.]|uniref:NADP-dependent oxidoreductase n=1 Tax=Sphingobium sp. TaxID=1912891 RepID=UPI002ED2CBA5